MTPVMTTSSFLAFLSYFGMGLREDATLITRSTSRFVPHVILD